MEATTKKIWTIIFYGSVWGLLEAVIGYMLHLLPTFIAGTIMFPIAMFVLVKAYGALDSKKQILMVGVVAAIIKSVGFLLPGLSPFKTLNPMIAIMMESLLVVLVIPYLSKAKTSYVLMSALVASIGWRGLFASYMLIQALISSNVAPYLSSVNLVINFVLINGLFGGLLCFGLLWANRKLNKSTHESIKWTWIPSTGMMLLALILTFVL